MLWTNVDVVSTVLVLPAMMHFPWSQIILFCAPIEFRRLHLPVAFEGVSTLGQTCNDEYYLLYDINMPADDSAQELGACILFTFAGSFLGVFLLPPACSSSELEEKLA